METLNINDINSEKGDEEKKKKKEKQNIVELNTMLQIFENIYKYSIFMLSIIDYFIFYIKKI